MFFTNNDRMINWQDSLVTDQKKTILFIGQMGYNVPIIIISCRSTDTRWTNYRDFIETRLILRPVE